jgi:hypothetical protein
MRNKTVTILCAISFLSLTAFAASGEKITGYYYNPNAGVVIPQYDNAIPNPEDTAEYTPENPDPVTPPVVVIDPATVAQAQAQVAQAQSVLNAAQTTFDASKSLFETAQNNFTQKQANLLTAQEELSQTWDNIINPKNLGQFISALINLPKKMQAVNNAQAQLQTAQGQLSSAQLDFTQKSNQLTIAQETLTQAQTALDGLGQT